MANIKRRLVQIANRVLKPLSLQLDSLTAANREMGQIHQLQKDGHFDRMIYSLPECVKTAAYQSILADLPKYGTRFASFTEPDHNDVRFSSANPFYTSPDAEILYILVRQLAPRRIFETGCGNSTRVIRQAIIDGNLPSKVTSVDPEPRTDITGFTDEILRCRIEALDPAEIATGLAPGDILFIDTSHEGRACNDVAYLFCRLIPLLKAGVVVHVHDVFLPWEYPQDWIVREKRLAWTEQYLLHALISSNKYKILWPGYYLQKTLPNFNALFPRIGSRRAQSFWFVI